jgi:hypothetical protein
LTTGVGPKLFSNLLFGALLFVSPWLFAFAHGTAGADAFLLKPVLA